MKVWPENWVKCVKLNFDYRLQQANNFQFYFSFPWDLWWMEINGSQPFSSFLNSWDCRKLNHVFVYYMSGHVMMIIWQNFFQSWRATLMEKIVDKSIITMSIRCHYGWDVWTRMLYFEVTWCQIKKHWRCHSIWFNEWDCCCWFVLFGKLLDCKLIYLEIRCSRLWSGPKLYHFQLYVH